MSTLDNRASLQARRFHPRGRVIVRRSFTHGDRERQAEEPFDASAEGVDERTLRVFWEQGLVDTFDAPAPKRRGKLADE